MADGTFQSSNTPVQLILESWDHYLELEPTSTYSFLYFIAVTGIGYFNGFPYLDGVLRMPYSPPLTCSGTSQ